MCNTIILSLYLSLYFSLSLFFFPKILFSYIDEIFNYKVVIIVQISKKFSRSPFNITSFNRARAERNPNSLNRGQSIGITFCKFCVRTAGKREKKNNKREREREKREQMSLVGKNLSYLYHDQIFVFSIYAIAISTLMFNIQYLQNRSS